jgi:curved DNA-binding protein CbpA
MSSPKNLEIAGNLSEHPLAELLIEILQARLDGSLRLTHHDHKAIIYFNLGEIVFAVSNQRQHRIFEMLLQADMITKQKLVAIPEFTNDLALTKELKEKENYSINAISAIFSRQIEAILRDAIEWKDGSWNFSPLARIKDDIHHKVDVHSLLIEKGRNLSNEIIVQRFKSFTEKFGRHPSPPAHISLQPREAFLLSRFDHSFLKIEEIKTISGMTDMETMQTLYMLWMGGFIYRQNWKAAFSEHYISGTLSAKFELKKQTATPSKTVQTPTLEPQKTEEAEENTAVENSIREAKEELTLEKYLERVEDAETHYQILDISMKAETSEVKQAYFSLAKRFHPDLFHKKTDAETHQRIQHAFTEIAHAYEVLRNENTRQTYDFKLRKVLEELEKLSPEERKETKPTPTKKLTEASDIFEHGFNLLMEDDYEAAIPFLARASALAPDIARYHAYYGKSLSIDRTQKFKAESEIQTAIKMDPENPDFRIMLAEFFIQYKLFKRAEGELNRLLENNPNNYEAHKLLDSLA